MRCVAFRVCPGPLSKKVRAGVCLVTPVVCPAVQTGCTRSVQHRIKSVCMSLHTVCVLGVCRDAVWCGCVSDPTVGCCQHPVGVPLGGYNRRTRLGECMPCRASYLHGVCIRFKLYSVCPQLVVCLGCVSKELKEVRLVMPGGFLQHPCTRSGAGAGCIDPMLLQERWDAQLCFSVCPCTSPSTALYGTPLLALPLRAEVLPLLSLSLSERASFCVNAFATLHEVVKCVGVAMHIGPVQVHVRVLCWVCRTSSWCCRCNAKEHWMMLTVPCRTPNST